MHIYRRPGRPPVLNSPRTSAQTGSIESRGLWEARHSFHATADLPYFIIIYLDSAEKIARKVGRTARCHSWVICSFKSNLLSETGSLTPFFFSEPRPRMPWRWSALAFSRCVSTTSTKVWRKPGRTDWTKACETKIIRGVSHYFFVLIWTRRASLGDWNWMTCLRTTCRERVKHFDWQGMEDECSDAKVSTVIIFHFPTGGWRAAQLFPSARTFTTHVTTLSFTPYQVRLLSF